MKPPDPARTAEGRLLCAANLAYEANATGGVGVKAPFTDGAGFQSPPVSFVAGPGGIHACIMGQNQDGIVIAFRGTLPPAPVTMQSLADWMNNVILLPPQQGAKFKGKLHEGFYSGFESLWPSIEKQLKEWNPEGARPVCITGHSKGGALAFACAARMKEAGLPAPAMVITFCAPRCGDREFAASLSGIRIIRYENAGDLVPLMPPDFGLIALTQGIPYVGETLAKAQDWEFEHTGELRYLNAEGKVEGQSALLFMKRGQDIFSLLKNSDEGATAIMNAHSIGCGSALQKLLTPELNCK